MNDVGLGGHGSPGRRMPTPEALLYAVARDISDRQPPEEERVPKAAP